MEPEPYETAMRCSQPMDITVDAPASHGTWGRVSGNADGQSLALRSCRRRRGRRNRNGPAALWTGSGTFWTELALKVPKLTTVTEPEVQRILGEALLKSAEYRDPGTQSVRMVTIAMSRIHQCLRSRQQFHWQFLCLYRLQPHRPCRYLHPHLHPGPPITPTGHYHPHH